jgi:hypothetical protein
VAVGTKRLNEHVRHIVRTASLRSFEVQSKQMSLT